MTGEPQVIPPETCSLRSSEKCVDVLEETLSELKDQKRANKFPRRPDSFRKVHDKTLRKRRPEKPPRRDDLCRNIYWERSCSRRSAKVCGNDFVNIISDNEDVIIHDAIGDSDVCDHMCDRNPCENQGTCVEEVNGFRCECLDGFEGKYCEIDKPPVIRCDYYAAYACLDIFQTSESYFRDNLISVYCSSLHRQIACLTAHLMVCSEPDQAFVELMFFFFDSLKTNCIIKQKPTCEQMELYIIFQEVFSSIYTSAGMPPNTDGDFLCATFDFAYASSLKIKLKCAGTTMLSITASDKFSGAVDVFCRHQACGCHSHCSITKADECLERMYQVLLRDPFTKDNCDELWKHKKCVLDATEECDSDRTKLTLTAMNDVETINPDNKCPNPCSSKPCRNGGVCKQTSVDDYECMCPEGFTGKSCKTPKGCDFVAIRACLEASNVDIVSGMFDPCHPSIDCQTLTDLLLCIDINSKKCDKSKMAGVTQIKVSLELLSKSSCGIADTICERRPTECDVYAIQECYAKFTSITFAELASDCVANYAHICQNWAFTLKCIQEASVECTGRYKTSIDSSREWLIKLTGSRCLKAVCLPELAVPARTCVDQEIDFVRKRPSMPESDRAEFCAFVDKVLTAIDDNEAYCPSDATPSGGVSKDRRRRDGAMGDPADVPTDDSPGGTKDKPLGELPEDNPMGTNPNDGPIDVTTEGTTAGGIAKETPLGDLPAATTAGGIAKETPLGDLPEPTTTRRNDRFTAGGPAGDGNKETTPDEPDQPDLPDHKEGGEDREDVPKGTTQEPIPVNAKPPLPPRKRTPRDDLPAECKFPCQSNPCKNNGICNQTPNNDYECTCVGDFAGKNCDHVALYPHDNDTEVRCRDDRSIDSAEVHLKIPIKVFCASMSDFIITQDGYITFSSRVQTSDFSTFSGNGQTIFAPLFAKQDCSCSGSKISYQVYYPGDDSKKKHDVFSRSQRDLKGIAPDDFSADVIFVITWIEMLAFPCSIYKASNPDVKGSTYQVVYAATQQKGYVQFIYQETHTKSQGKNVHMGITTAQGLSKGSFLSGTASMDGFQDSKSNTGKLGSYIYSTDEDCSTTKSKPEDQCLDWLKNTVDLSQEHLDSCACSSLQGSLDPRYHLEYIDWFSHCYVVNRVQKIVSQGKTIRVKQVCCYDQFNKGALFSTPPFAGQATALDTPDGQANDTEAFNHCCVESNRYCSMYRTKRPSATCNKYTSVMEGLMWGDPHMITADGFSYTYNGVGEFTMIKTTDSSFRLQARTAQMKNGNGDLVGASAYVAFAAQETGSSKVQVELNEKQDGFLFYVDGVQQAPPSQPQIINSDIYVSASDQIINITFTSGWTTTIGVRMKMLSIRQTVPGVAWNKTQGLLGNFNGDTSDDLTDPDGKSIPLTSSNEEIYKFGNKWQIKQEESLFTYPKNKTTADYTDLNFKPEFEAPCKTDTDKKMGVQLCGDNKDCYFDYCMTKDPAVAAGTRATSDGFDNDRKILMSLGPKLTIKGSTPDSNGIYSIKATVGVEVSLLLYAESSQSVKINIEMLGNVSKESKVSLASMSSTRNTTSSIFKWTPKSLLPVDVSFIAVDANGAMSARLQAIVTICNGCGGLGSCQFTISSPINNGSAYRLADCSCNAGWAGNTCDKDYNGCQGAMSCANGAACTDLTAAQQAATGLLYSCSSCPPGYHTEQCIDIDECSTMPANSKCQICTNIVGSYTCRCRSGYRLSANKVECEDIDECAEQTSNCPQSCTNTVGSFTCGCQPGYQGANCDAVTACGQNQCSYKCAMINGQQKCSCMSGFSLASDGISCTDIDECSNPDLNRCSVKKMCNNTMGGYKCGCPVGSSVGDDLRVCQPCSDTTWGPNCANDCNCGPNVQTCTKTDGCTICRNGWQGPGCTVDVDECTTGTARCAETATCVNAAGTYMCKCADGSAYDCYATTTVAAVTTPMIPCDYNHCQNGGLCFLDSDDHAICSCSEGYAGEICDVVATQMTSQSKVGLIAGLSVLGAVLLLTAAALIFYFCIYPKIKAAQKNKALSSSPASSDIGSETRFNQSSTRINKFWPSANPNRYTPETYSSQNEDNPNVVLNSYKKV